MRSSEQPSGEVKILQLNAHTTIAPRYGGPLRSHHISRCLEHAGFEVSRVAVCSRTEHDVDDVREPIINIQISPFWSSKACRPALPWLPYLADYYSHFAVTQSAELVHEFRRLFMEARATAVLLEHPWTWPLIRDIPSVIDGSVPVVYSSQNVEAVLKRRMIEDARLHVPAEVLEDVEALERDLVRSAWGVIACTLADAEIFRAWGANHVVVANNGAVAKNRATLTGALPQPLRTHHRYGLFIGSNYLPNVTGFFRYIAPALVRLLPNTRIVIAGSVCDPIADRLALSPIGAYQERRLVNLGFVDDVTLDALIANASALLLPIEYGGGSHLKTAEAIVSCRPIIATTTSFRGFSNYKELPQVTLADVPEQFQLAIHKALASRTDANHNFQAPHELLWESTLAPILQLFEGLSDNRNSQFQVGRGVSRMVENDTQCPS
jgi:hypothetical protein